MKGSCKEMFSVINTQLRKVRSFRLRPYSIPRWILILFGVSLILSIYQITHDPKLAVESEVSSSFLATAQLSYVTGEGKRTGTSKRVNPDWFHSFQKITFEIPNGSVSNLQLKVVAGDGNFEFRNFRITDWDGILEAIPPSAITPVQAIRGFTAHDDMVDFSTGADSQDHVIAINFGGSVQLKQMVRHEIERHILIQSALVLGLVIVGLLWKMIVPSNTNVFRLIGTANRNIARRLSSPLFIQFDSLAVGFYLLCALIFFSASIADLNGSSIGVYSSVLRHGALEKTWIGSPRFIRADEWKFNTPHILYQRLRMDPFQVREGESGDRSVSLLDNIPIKYPTTILRPQFWSFFVLPVDYAFALFWQFKAFILLTGTFTLFLIITRSSPCAIIGALWFFFSACTQWCYSWPSDLPEMIGLICFTVVLGCYLTVGRNYAVLALAAICAASCAVNFALCAYVPHMIPLCWFAALLFFFWCVTERTAIWRRKELGRRIIALAFVAGIVITTGVLVYVDVREAIRAIAHTSYPGNRVFTGGSVSIQLLLSHFFGLWETEQRFPPELANICEASGYLWLAPVTLFFWGQLKLSRFQKGALAALWAGFLIILAWLVLPIPSGLAKILLLDRTGGTRCLPALGLMNVGIVVLSLTAFRKDTGERRTQSASWLHLALGSFGIFLPVLTMLLFTSRQFGSFFAAKEVLYASLYTTVLIVLLSEGKRIAFAVAILVPQIIFFGAVNPVERGLGVFTNSALYHYVRGHRQVLEGKWIVFSDYTWDSGFLVSTGCDVYTGLRYVPDTKHFPLFASSGLDPQLLNNDWWLIASPLLPNQKSSLDHVSGFVLKWNVSPTDPLLRKLGIRYLAFDRRPPESITARLVPLSDHDVDGFWLYKLP